MAAAPRPVVIGIVGAVLILAVLVATRLAGGNDDSSSDEATPAAAPAKSAASTPAPTPAAKPKPAVKAKEKATASKKPADRQAGLPVAVARALGHRKPVILFFGQRGGADDAATRKAVVATGRRFRGKVTVVIDSLSNIDDYSLVVRGLGIDQAPSIAIVDKGKKARVLTGFVDEGTLTQNVRDAIR